MDDAWETLKAIGLPDGAARPKPEPPLDRNRIRRAIEDLAGHIESLDPRRVEPLLAWLQGGYHHWPDGFAELLGPAGARLVDHLQRVAEDGIDRNRYLKLRRIAIENLSGVL